ncbi:hypothetical protein SAMN04487866_10917 [Thermoactinomyces sp. DSM 45891]|uniref:sigma-70 family RNA polymerase sigma factor n=1 Tax=Thermoactinomyces sp. DSM 45891 TaxID=1761907 RepID=UPI00091A47AE|nr:sigma-70 family RNA polymerase sigma factor [Thermoactinomyces sp. DSM 45891]SFX47723.1 hypothetical protein SAMN04487866_10917 [Thermoactinomyces sp. DSM 45891]
MSHIIDSGHRKYEQSYSFYTTKGVSRLLADLPKIKIRAYERGETAAIDICLDLQKAIQLAKLTPKQKEAIRHLYVYDRGIVEAAELLDIDYSTLSRTRKTALKKIAKVYKRWRYLE